MRFVSVAAYVADVWILATYFIMARWNTSPRAFHLANAIGCIPLIAVELVAHAYQPLVLTAAFGTFGWIGLWRTR